MMRYWIRSMVASRDDYRRKYKKYQMKKKQTVGFLTRGIEIYNKYNIFVCKE